VNCSSDIQLTTITVTCWHR